MDKYTKLKVWIDGNVIAYSVPNEWLNAQRGYDFEPEELYAAAVFDGIIEPHIGFDVWAKI